MWQQKQLHLPPFSRGFHLITNEIELALPELRNFQLGLCQLFIQHSSASLSINENADPTVRSDLEKHLCHMVPENQSYYQHTYEGPDDMPAHIKASLIGNSLSIPIRQGRLALGTWQGIYLGEHRNQASGRSIMATLQGETY